jgi:ABC-type transport system involved in multi-copper enzyme maturation permease subunit
MNSVLALSGIVIKELYRRKDFYVLFVMTAVITLLMASVRFFNDSNIVRYLKDICLLLIWISALVIAIVTTARQLPAERENRTIFPLLAKPVSRGQVIVGKFLGCWLACGIALVFFYFFFMVVCSSREHIWPLALYFKGFWLQWVMLGIVAALALLGSLVFAAPSSNSTILFVIVGGILLLGGHLNQVALHQPGPLGSAIYTIYFLIPHLEWYNVRDMLVYNRDSLGWGACALATVYGAVYVALVLTASWLVFRRKALNV